MASAQSKTVPVISSEQLQVGNQWIWNYYEQGECGKFYSSERYTVVVRNRDWVTIDLWTQVATATVYTPSARFVINLQDCWSAFSGPRKKEFQITVHAFEKNKWSVEGYKVSSTAFEEKFNCNPYIYAQGAPAFETLFATVKSKWGEWLTFQQKPKAVSQLQSFYFFDHPALRGIAYQKRFNPLSPYEFAMELSHFEMKKNAPRP